MENSPPSLVRLSSHQPTESDISSPQLPDLFTADELRAFEDDESIQQVYPANTSLTMKYRTQQQQPGAWCTWIEANISLSVLTDVPTVKADTELMAVLRIGRPYAHHNANLIIQALRSFPTMMLRRTTFPWFIHPHSRTPARTTTSTLPSAIANCISIAQMFVSRTPETGYFFRQTIETEHHRLTSQMYSMSPPDVLAAMQACMIYLIMYIIDYTPGDEVYIRDLRQALLDLYSLFKSFGNGCGKQDELSPADDSWEEWIYVESQKRFASLWLLVGCVVCVKNGYICDAQHSYRSLLLPCSKSLWEAPTSSAWRAEREACRSLPGGLITLGDLIDAQRAEHKPANARKLDMWNAQADNLGCLLI